MKKPRRRRQESPPPDGAHRGPTFPIVGIGASAGGLEAFSELLKHLPLDTGMAFVLVQHLDPEHESALAQILSRVTAIPVRQIASEEAVSANCVHVIPRDATLSIDRGVLKLEPRPKSRAPHRPIDAFFESLARDSGDRAIGVVLSGTGTDGTLGLEAIKSEGGITFAQDDSAKHDSMPRSAVAAGCVDLVLAPGEIAVELARIARHPYVSGQRLALLADQPGDDASATPGVEGAGLRGETDRAEATAHEDDATALPSGGPAHADRSPARDEARAGAGHDLEPGSAAARSAEDGYKKILLHLRNHSGVDFSLYKSTTIRRRINRRMVLTKHETPTAYASFLRGNARELDALYSDVLISVTSFFRNPEMFDALQHAVWPTLLEHRGDDPLRCWVLGCSTGQEAYSIAISFLEAAEKAPRARKLQVFATDLNEALLEKARHGLYARTLEQELAPERLRRFFVEEEGGYRVNKALREMVVFARQNLIADPPFSRMDLISCRNLLIYLEPSLQKKAMPTFHYALKPAGYLLLGASESIGGFTDLFEPVDKKHKIYAKKPAPTPAFHLPLAQARGERGGPDRRPLLPMPTSEAAVPPELRGELNAQREADRITVNQFSPPGVLIDDALQVLQFRGPTGDYLEPPPGKASFDVLKMAREGLMLPLRAAINDARKDNKPVRIENVRVQQNGSSRKVHLEVVPLKNLRERCFLVFFEDASKSARNTRAVTAPKAKTLSPRQELSRIAELESELRETRDYLQSLQEQQEAANEELQAANEEVQSANEELQSVNEELETSKEELESSNEELITVKEEMNHRNLELNRLNNDLVNLQTSTRLSIMLVGRDLSVRRFSPQAQKQFELLSTDVGRPVSHLRHSLVHVSAADHASHQGGETVVDLEAIISEVIASVREQEFEVRDRTRHWYSLRVRPYLTLDNRVDGAVLILVDIDTTKRAQDGIADALAFAENTLATVRDPMLVLDRELRIENANRAFYRTFHYSPSEVVGKRLAELGDGQWQIPQLRELLETIVPRNATIEDFEVEQIVPGVGPRTLILNARRMIDPLRRSERILLAIEDTGARMRAQEATPGSRQS